MSDSYTQGRLVGAMPPPPGETVNFVDPPNHNADLIAQHTVLLFFVLLFVGIRVFVRVRISSHFGYDDAMCIIGTAFAIAYAGAELKATDYGFGYHLWDVPVTETISFGKWLFIVELLATPCWLFIKLAVLCSYRRAFQGSKAMSWLSGIGIFIVTGFYVGYWFANLFWCTPIKKQWNPSVPGHCVNLGVGGSVSAIFNAITDFLLLILPMPFAWSLQMRLSARLRLMAVLGLGAFVNACSWARVGISYVVADNPDLSWKVYTESLWTTLEIDIGLICVAALALPAFWKRICAERVDSLRHMLGSKMHSTSYFSNNSNHQNTMPDSRDRTLRSASEKNLYEDERYMGSTAAHEPVEHV